MWVEIENYNVRQFWLCRKCDRTIHCTPDTYADVGVPICPNCGQDMEYVKTEVYKQ